MTVYYTVHSQKAMAERSVDRAEVEKVVLNPQVIYQGRADRPEYRVYQNGELGVVVKPDNEGDLLVITVLWRNPDQWTSDEMRSSR